MESCAARVIVLPRRLDGRLLLALPGRRERLLEAADRRAESASCLWQSLGSEHDQRDGENQEQVCGAEEVLDHLWSLSCVVRASRPAAVRAPGACSSSACDHPLSALRLASRRGMATTRDLLQRPLVDALIRRPTNAARRTAPHSRRSLLTLS